MCIPYISTINRIITERSLEKDVANTKEKNRDQGGKACNALHLHQNAYLAVAPPATLILA